MQENQIFVSNSTVSILTHLFFSVIIFVVSIIVIVFIVINLCGAHASRLVHHCHTSVSSSLASAFHRLSLSSGSLAAVLIRFAWPSLSHGCSSNPSRIVSGELGGPSLSDPVSGLATRPPLPMTSSGATRTGCGEKGRVIRGLPLALKSAEKILAASPSPPPPLPCVVIVTAPAKLWYGSVTAPKLSARRCPSPAAGDRPRVSPSVESLPAVSARMLLGGKILNSFTPSPMSPTPPATAADW